MRDNTDIDAPVDGSTTITYRMVDIYRHMIDNPDQFQLVECKIDDKTTVAIAHLMSVGNDVFCTPLFSWIGPDANVKGVNGERGQRIEFVDNIN